MPTLPARNIAKSSVTPLEFSDIPGGESQGWARISVLTHLLENISRFTLRRNSFEVRFKKPVPVAKTTTPIGSPIDS